MAPIWADSGELLDETYWTDGRRRGHIKVIAYRNCSAALLYSMRHCDYILNVVRCNPKYGYDALVQTCVSFPESITYADLDKCVDAIERYERWNCVPNAMRYWIKETLILMMKVSLYVMSATSSRPKTVTTARRTSTDGEEAAPKGD